MSQICLVVIYNHNFEKNIETIRKIYQDKFGHVVQLMPFYRGDRADVIRVFGNSLQFHQYIAQARSRLLEIPCDRYLFIGDDLLLNPVIHQDNFQEIFGVGPDDCYISKFQDVSQAQAACGTLEAHAFKMMPFGLDASALARIPSFDEALSILQSKRLLRSTRLRHMKLFMHYWVRPVLRHPLANLRIFRGRLYQLIRKLWYLVRGYRISYPVVFGYSDIFSLPKQRLTPLCDYLEVFAAMGMFVELAIPTAFALHDWPLKHEQDATLQPLDIWFPFEPHLRHQKVMTIRTLEETADRKLSNLAAAFPAQYLYMHPVKLSYWT